MKDIKGFVCKGDIENKKSLYELLYLSKYSDKYDGIMFTYSHVGTSIHVRCDLLKGKSSLEYSCIFQYNDEFYNIGTFSNYKDSVKDMVKRNYMIDKLLNR